MDWARTIFGKVAIIALGVLVYTQFGEEGLFLYFLGVVATNVDYIFVMANNHAKWLVDTHNVPSWAMWFASFLALVIGGPMVIEIAGSIWEVVSQSFEVVRCVAVIALFGVAFGFYMIHRHYRRRRRPTTPTNLT